MALNVINECNEQVVEWMVGKAMCAYANWQEVDSIPYLTNGYDKAEAKGRFEAEYEATVRCLGMLVRDSLPAVCRYVIDRAHEEFGI